MDERKGENEYHGAGRQLLTREPPEADPGREVRERVHVSPLDESRLYRFRQNYTWEGVEPQPYKPEQRDWTDAVRQVIVGGGGERTGFHVRYFEIGPGGYTSLEKHEHSHVVIAVRGKGTVIAGDQCWDLEFLTGAYVAPNTPHQLVNPGGEPFGFFCIVDAVRDRPQPLSREEVERFQQNPQLRDALKCGPPQ
jgi:quercetin dioxygenase-like cupin family protein